VDSHGHARGSETRPRRGTGVAVPGRVWSPGGAGSRQGRDIALFTHFWPVYGTQRAQSGTHTPPAAASAAPRARRTESEGRDTLVDADSAGPHRYARKILPM